MQPARREAIRSALDELKPRLAALIATTAAKFPGMRPPPSDADTTALLTYIFDNGGAFGLHINLKLRTYLHEVRAIRNDWAHERAFDASDVERALDTVRRVAALIGTPLADAPGRAAAPPARTTASRITRTQRDVMREVWRKFGPDEGRVVREYAQAERRGEALRRSNQSGRSPEEYARALLADGQKKGWLD